MASVTDLFKDLRELTDKLLEQDATYLGEDSATAGVLRGRAQGQVAAGKQLEDILRRYNIYKDK